MAGPFPEWIKQTWGWGGEFGVTRGILEDLQLHTVCQSARCPNLGECWRKRTATIMVLGNVCTRKCAFCSVKSQRSGAQPAMPDPEEPGRVAQAARKLGWRHAVITSVTRDDMADGGAGHFAKTVEAIRNESPDCTVEVLTPDFNRNKDAVRTVMDAEPHVFGHNIETVRRLYAELRDQNADYRRSIEVLKSAAARRANTIVKSALMLGHGETEQEVRETLEDLLNAGCSAVCIGQYLRPGKKERGVARYIEPARFKGYEQTAREMGFAFAVAGPFVRSSYKAGEMLQNIKRAADQRDKREG